MYTNIMKKPLQTAFFLVLALSLMSCSNPTEPDSILANRANFVNYSSIEWVSTSLIYSSTTAKKPLSILYFTDDACSDGVLMDNNTFLDSSVIVALNSSYNIARISTTNDSLIQFNDGFITGNALFKQFNLVGVPSLLILDSDNSYFGRIQANYYPSEQFLSLLEFYKNKE